MFQSILSHLKLILAWGIVLGLLSAGVSLAFPKQYSADAQVLIISRDRTGVDPYTQAKSAERIGQNLAQTMKTPDFFGKVMSGGADFNKEIWNNLSERKQRKKWAKDVQGAMAYGSGLLNVRAYGSTKADAVNLSNAVSQTVAGQGWEYIGGDVALKVVATPLVSRLPARPNIVLNAVIGFLTGVLLAGLWTVKRKNEITKLEN